MILIKAQPKIKEDPSWRRYVERTLPKPVVRGHMIVLRVKTDKVENCRVALCWCSCGKRFTIKSHHVRATRHCGCRDKATVATSMKPDFTNEVIGLVRYGDRHEVDGRTFYRGECACRKGFEIYWRDVRTTRTCGSPLCEQLLARHLTRKEAAKILDKLRL